MLCFLVLFTHFVPYFVIAMYLSCLSLKQESITSGKVMLEYRVENSKFETDEVLFCYLV